jgi:hypothetical protein
MQNKQSEIARLRKQITDEHEAGKLAMQGLSQGSSTHQFITNRMEKMCTDVDELVAIGGEDVAKETLMALR